MYNLTELNLPESHYNILKVISALAWADGNLSEEEINMLIDQFKTDLPIEPHPIFYTEDSTALFGLFTEKPPVADQLTARINAELAFKEVLLNYKYNPISLADLVAELKTQEDRCLTVKLAYMVIKISPDPQNQDKLVSDGEKKAYRQLIELVNIDSALITKIEAQAEEELEHFLHPFSAFIANLKYFLQME
jgi:hypothetical protein